MGVAVRSHALLLTGRYHSEVVPFFLLHFSPLLVHSHCYISMLLFLLFKKKKNSLNSGSSTATIPLFYCPNAELLKKLSTLAFCNFSVSISSWISTPFSSSPLNWNHILQGHQCTPCGLKQWSVLHLHHVCSVSSVWLRYVSSLPEASRTPYSLGSLTGCVRWIVSI